MTTAANPSDERTRLARAVGDLAAAARARGLGRLHAVRELAALADAVDCPPDLVDAGSLGDTLEAVEQLFKALDRDDMHAPGALAERCSVVEDLLTGALAIRLAGESEAA